MISIRSLVVMALLCGNMAYSLELQEEHCTEITSRWQQRWDEQLDEVRGQPDMKRYADTMLQIEPKDVELAEQFIMRLCQGSLWEQFLERKDVEATLEYISYMTMILQQVIDSECQLTFPPYLQEFANEIKRSGLQEDEFIMRVRQSFLAFTIIVSHMSYVCMEGNASQ